MQLAHLRTPAVERCTIAAFKASDVDSEPEADWLWLVVLMPDGEVARHLGWLAHLAAVLRDEDNVRRLKMATTGAKVAETIEAVLAVDGEVVVWWWVLPPLLVLTRWLVRGHLSPTSVDLGLPRERRFAPAGSTGVLLVACAVLVPYPGPALVGPLVAAWAVATLVSDVVERRPTRGEVPA